MTDVVIPADIWTDNSEGAISAWLYAEGDVVEAGVVIAEVMNEKTTFEIDAPASGRLSILVPADVSVRPGQLIAQIS
jgi:pyruvate/2-oxoglutarate dehydrogenase complex dihydrolipoamide acyltransferase (E2) component